MNKINMFTVGLYLQLESVYVGSILRQVLALYVLGRDRTNNYNLRQNRRKICTPPSPPLPTKKKINDGKMARFGFCSASFFGGGGGGDGGLLFQFILSKIVDILPRLLNACEK